MSLNSPAYVQAFFGTFFAGAVVVPVNHQLAPPEVEKDKSLDEESIKSYLEDKSAKFKIPRKYHFVDALPHTASGKVMAYQLRDSYSADK